MQDPGQWFASSAVTVTGTSSGPVSSTRVLSGISFCRAGRERGVSGRRIKKSACRPRLSCSGTRVRRLATQTHDPVNPCAPSARPRRARPTRARCDLDLEEIGELALAANAAAELFEADSVSRFHRIEHELLGDGRRVNLAVEMGRVEPCRSVRGGGEGQPGGGLGASENGEGPRTSDVVRVGVCQEVKVRSPARVGVELRRVAVESVDADEGELFDCARSLDGISW